MPTHAPGVCVYDSVSRQELETVRWETKTKRQCVKVSEQCRLLLIWSIERRGEKKLSGDTFKKVKTKVWHLSPLCHLQAQAIIYSAYAAKHWIDPKNGLENVPDCWESGTLLTYLDLVEKQSGSCLRVVNMERRGLDKAFNHPVPRCLLEAVRHAAR